MLIQKRTLRHPEINREMIMPTQEEYLKYWENLNDIIKSCSYTSPTNVGDIAQRIESHDAIYELVRNKHSRICDNPLCRGIFHRKNKEDGGASKKYIYTLLPIYEATESLIKAMRINGSSDGLENFESGLNKWRELGDFC